MPSGGVRQRAILFFEAAGWLVAARLMVGLVPFKHLAALMSRRPSRRTAEVLRDETGRMVEEVQQAIASATYRLPGEFACLPRAIAAQAMLRRRGQAATVFFGAAKHADTLATHAWLQCGRHGVVGHETVSEYQIVARYPAVSLGTRLG